MISKALKPILKFLQRREALEKQLEQKEKEFDNLSDEIKKLNRILKNKEKSKMEKPDGEKKNQELSTLAEEIKILRELKKIYDNKNRIDEKNFKKQQEFYTNLEKRYKEYCTKLGVDPVIGPLPADLGKKEVFIISIICFISPFIACSK